MNTDKLYHMNNFDSYNNIFTIYIKHIVTHKRITDDNESDLIDNNGKRKYKILSDYYKYIPVYGHYYNGKNDFICKKIQNHRIIEDKSPNNFIIVKNEELAKPYKGGLYTATNIDDLYDILERLNKYKGDNEN